MGTDVVFIGQLSARVKKIERGVVGIRKAADDVGVRLATPTRLTLARHLIGDPAYQVRALGVFMLGDLAARSAPALKLLRDTVSADDDPRVQQVLAKAFDAYCAEIGYAQVLITVTEPPLAVAQNLRATSPRRGQVVLTWTNPRSSATGLQLNRVHTVGRRSVQVTWPLALTQSRFTDTTARSGTRYTYTLSATKDTATVFSNSVVITAR